MSPRRSQLGGQAIGETEELEVTVLMSDIRGYSGIAERADPSALARQLNEHRAEMNHAVLDAGGTVMQFVGDAVMAVFGAPVPLENHADRALRGGVAHARAPGGARTTGGRPRAWLPFGLGIGLSTGPVAAALLGSEERLEYTVVGDTVNLSQRLQDLARPAGSDRAQRGRRYTALTVAARRRRSSSPTSGQGSA